VSPSVSERTRSLDITGVSFLGAVSTLSRQCQITYSKITLLQMVLGTWSVTPRRTAGCCHLANCLLWKFYTGSNVADKLLWLQSYKVTHTDDRKQHRAGCC